MDCLLAPVSAIRLDGLIRPLLAALSIAILTPVIDAHAAADDDGPSLPLRNVALVYDGPGPTGPGPERFMELASFLIKETKELTRREFDVRFPDELQQNGGWDLQTLSQVIDRLLADPNVHAIVALGPLGAADVCGREPLSKPVLAPFAIDIVSLGLPSITDDKGLVSSGVPNLNYLVSPGSVPRDVEMFREIAGFQRLHILADSLLLQALPQLEDLARGYADDLGVEMVLVPAGDTATSAIAAIPADAEAVYVAPMYRLSEAEFDRMVGALNERRLPTFSLQGRDEVERGVLAGARPATNFERMARRLALNLRRNFDGEDVGDLSVVLEGQERLTINAATMRLIGHPIPWRTVIEAEVIHETVVGGRALTLDQSVREAIAANLGLRARRQDVIAGAEEIDQARSVYKPFIDISASGILVDADRAAASFGSLSERTASSSLGLTQLIYSDAALANISVSRDLQTSREHDWDALRLDIALDTAVAFLDVLRAENQEAATRENLRLTEENLQRARNREAIGFSGLADVYRWEAELARARIVTIQAVHFTRAARLRLNQLMNRPQREPYMAAPPELEDSSLISGVGRLRPYIDNVMAENVFTEFLVQEGLANSLELAALDSSILAQERTSVGLRRSYWAPDISFFTDYERTLGRGGAGSARVSAIPGFDLPDDDSWSVGLFATLPIYTGGERGSLFRQSNDSLTGLRLDRATLAESIELNVRVNMTRVGSSFPSITLSREAAAASQRNLELVTDSYSRGVVSIIDLLDAQNSAVTADLDAANSEFNFLIDLMTLQRSVTNIGFLMSAPERDLWFQRLEQFFAEKTPRSKPRNESLLQPGERP